jgi:hypothetical protein
MVNWPVHVAGRLNVVLIAKTILDAEEDAMLALRNSSKQFRLSKFCFQISTSRTWHFERGQEGNA